MFIVTEESTNKLKHKMSQELHFNALISEKRTKNCQKIAQKCPKNAEKMAINFAVKLGGFKRPSFPQLETRS